MDLLLIFAGQLTKHIDCLMTSKYYPEISAGKLRSAIAAEDPDVLYDLLAQPLHEALFAQKSFEFYDQLSEGQQLLIAFDYLRMQVQQGGFIQFIHNGYVSLLPDLINAFNLLELPEVAALLDDVLKVFVLNRDYFIKAVSVEDFARLYDELTEFEILDERFAQHYEQALRMVLSYAVSNIPDIATLVNREQ